MLNHQRTRKTWLKEIKTKHERGDQVAIRELKLRERKAKS